MARIFLRKLHHLIGVFVGIILLGSCIDDHLQKIIDGKIKVQLSPELEIPVAQFRMELQDILRNEGALITDSNDLSLRLIYRDASLLNKSVGDVLNIPDQSLSTTSTRIGPVRINDFTVQKSLTLNEILPSLDSTTRRALFVADSMGVQVPFPSIPLQSGGTHAINPISVFNYAVLDSGRLQVSITNQWAATIGVLVLNVKNPGNQSIGKIRFFNLTPNSSGSSFIDLQYQTLNSNLSFAIDSIHVPSSTQPVPVALNQSLTINVTGTGLMIASANAQIPGQNLGTDTSKIDFSFDNGERIYEIMLDSGSLNLDFRTSVPINIRCSIAIPGIRNLNGIPLNRTFTITGGSPNLIRIDLSNHLIDLKQYSRGFNELEIIFSKEILPSANSVNISQDDSITFSYSLNNLRLNYAKGSFGTRNIVADPATANLDLEFLKQINGTVFIANPQIRFNIQNSLGVPSRLNLELSGSRLGNAPVTINLNNQTIPTPASIGSVATGTLQINRNNSSLPQLLSLPPDSLRAGGSIELNPNGLNDTNFVTKSSALSIGMEIEIPFELSVRGLGFQDTAEFSGLLFESLESASLIIKAENGFPFDFITEFAFLDSNMNIVHQDSINLMPSAAVDMNGKVISPAFNTARIALNAQALKALEHARYMATEFTLQTPQNGQQIVKIYSDYHILLKVGVEGKGKFNIP